MLFIFVITKLIMDFMNDIQEELKNELERLWDPIEAVTGMLKHVKKSSVELQPEVGKIWSAKHK